MKENFLRPPSGTADYLADALRIIGLLSVVAAAIWLEPTDAGLLALTLPALVAPRFLAARASLDIAFSVTVLLAAWSNVIDLYRTVDSWDIVMHAVCMGVLVPMAYLLLAQWGVVPSTSSPAFRKRVTLVLYPVLGLALGAVWEMIEWAGFVFVSDDIFVEYHDTIGDMAIGALGSLGAGIALAGARLDRE